jgi:metallo-beta-lactamase family protein
MGSGMAEITCTDCPTPRKLLFTGDIGRVRDSQIAPGKVVYAGPQEGEAVDILVMESTYGNRLHPTTDPRPELIKTIKDTVARGGTVVVPAFAVERTQKFLFMIKDLIETGQIPRVPVHCDSPMAIKAIQIYIKHSEEYSEEAKVLIQKYGSPLKWEGFFFDTRQEDSKKINDSHFPQIIISSSGMVTGGRILHHLIHRLSDPKNTIIFIGFQAPGTRGAIIKSGAKSVKIFNQDVAIRAQVAAIEQFSDHADTPELLEWLRTFKKAPQVTYLVHGEPAASSQLRLAMTSALGWKVEAAQWMQKVEVK